ncbi:MAG: DUF4292 domain-containing protein [Brumimicrobium sp.]
MLRSIIKPALSALVLVILFSCGVKKESIQEGTEKLPKVKEDVLINRLDSLSQQRPEHFYARLNTKYISKDDNLSFIATSRIRKDSALQVTISFANIPMINAMITPDSLTLVDRRNKCYIKQGINFFKYNFNVDFSHKNLEELFLGLPISWNSDLEYKQLKDPYNYIVSLFEDENNTDFNINYFLSDDTKFLKKIMINSPKDTVSVIVDYSERIIIDGFNVPQQVNVAIKTPKNDIFVDLKHTRTRINEPNVLYLAIPDKYEECE